MLVRQMMTLDSWILSSQLPPNLSLPSTRNKVWEKIKADNQAASSADTSVGERSLDLPLSIRHPRKARTVIPAPVESLPASIASVSIATELEITASLVSELNTLHCLNLTERPEVKRDRGLPTAGLGGCKLVLGEGDILYLDLYSNTVYMGSDEFGMPVPVFKNSSGSFHMSRFLETAPEAFLRKCFSLVRNLLQMAYGRQHHHHLRVAATALCPVPLLQ